MSTRAAVEEFANILRLGAQALKGAIATDKPLGEVIEPDVNEILYLADRIDEIGERLRQKVRNAADPSNREPRRETSRES